MYLACLSVLVLCPINDKTAETIGPKVVWDPRDGLFINTRNYKQF